MSQPKRGTPLTDALVVDPSEFCFAYDSVGHYAWHGCVSPDDVALLGEELDTLGWGESNFPLTRRIDDLVERSPLFAGLGAQLFETPWLLSAMTYPHRLIESYALDRRRGGTLPLHGGAGERLTRAGHPEAEDVSSAYFVRSGRMYSFRTKALLYLDAVLEDADGPLVYVEGSHKANFPFMQTYADGPRSIRRPDGLVRSIPVEKGSLVLLNEALVHGALEKRNDGRRRVVVFTFAPSFVRDWSELPRDASGPAREGYAVPDAEDSH
jgi:hypothetical protein